MALLRSRPPQSMLEGKHWDLGAGNPQRSTRGRQGRHHFAGHKEDAKDQRISKVRIRLSTLETDRVYTHFYPLLVLQPSGLKKTGELHLAVRFTCTTWVIMVTLYGKPLLPKMHYT
ncbi:hypothetical protein Cni_G01588 [Canna indica]|uniref:Uncharacterized protein n=1 Tax=Canna indica TaxID=4628 RepID=A0AAQ3JNH3_9LILI|nr:hypothetical protein Cni_G01588 [Canna indica]